MSYNKAGLSNGVKYFTNIFFGSHCSTEIPKQLGLFLQFQHAGQVCKGSRPAPLSEAKFSFHCYELNPII